MNSSYMNNFEIVRSKDHPDQNYRATGPSSKLEQFTLTPNQEPLHESKEVPPMPRDYAPDSLNDFLDERLPAISSPSPQLCPRLFMESPALFPRSNYFAHKPYESPPLFSQRKSSIASLNTDMLGNMLDMDPGMTRKERLESIPPLNNEDLYDYGIRGEEKMESLSDPLPEPESAPEPIAGPALRLLQEENKKPSPKGYRVTLPLTLPPQEKPSEKVEKESFSEPVAGSIHNQVLKTIEQDLEPQEPPVQKIGTLTLAERRAKVLKYWAKKRRRTWRKKVSYSCRKEMASKRLRIKGRFVSREQAYAQFGVFPEEITDPEAFNSLITEKTGGKKDRQGKRKRPKGRRIKAVHGKAEPAAESNYHLRRKRPRAEQKIVKEVPIVVHKVFALHRARADNVPDMHKHYHSTAKRSQQ